eukprot:EC095475.1.p4 GENE.EC095475.1~~EC095475.1.p4  ORF type:complete len:101 (-),score=12.20 EC095475.1:180-482(-)
MQENCISGVSGVVGCPGGLLLPLGVCLVLALLFLQILIWPVGLSSLQFVGLPSRIVWIFRRALQNLHMDIASLSEVSDWYPAISSSIQFMQLLFSELACK